MTSYTVMTNGIIVELERHGVLSLYWVSEYSHEEESLVYNVMVLCE